MEKFIDNKFTSSRKCIHRIKYGSGSLMQIKFTNHPLHSDEFFFDKNEITTWPQVDVFLKITSELSPVLDNFPKALSYSACDTNVCYLEDLGNICLEDLKVSSFLHKDQVVNLSYQIPTFITNLQLCIGKAFSTLNSRVLGPASLKAEIQEFKNNLPSDVQMSDLFQNEVWDFFTKTLLELICNQKLLPCHRDFRPANLLLKGNLIKVVDYQDACLGSYTYDLASFLNEIDLPKYLQDLFITNFFNLLPSTNKPSFLEFKKDLYVSQIQRGLKILARRQRLSKEKVFSPSNKKIILNVIKLLKKVNLPYYSHLMKKSLSTYYNLDLA